MLAVSVLWSIALEFLSRAVKQKSKIKDLWIGKSCCYSLMILKAQSIIEDVNKREQGPCSLI